MKKYLLEVNLEDLSAYDESLAEKIYKQPTEFLPIFEESAKEVADEITHPRPIEDQKMEDIQVLLTSDANCIPLRGMKVSFQRNGILRKYKLISTAYCFYVLAWHSI